MDNIHRLTYEFAATLVDIHTFLIILNDIYSNTYDNIFYLCGNRHLEKLSSFFAKLKLTSKCHAKVLHQNAVNHILKLDISPLNTCFEKNFTLSSASSTHQFDNEIFDPDAFDIRTINES